MRALWMVALAIGVGTLLFAHTTATGVLIGIGFLGLALFLYWRPLTYRLGLNRR